jgi:hypothetical protein
MPLLGISDLELGRGRRLKGAATGPDPKATDAIWIGPILIARWRIVRRGIFGLNALSIYFRLLVNEYDLSDHSASNIMFPAFNCNRQSRILIRLQSK